MAEELENTAETNVEEQNAVAQDNEAPIAEGDNVANEPNGSVENQEDNKSQEDEAKKAEEAKKAQTKEENAEFARKRREQETQAKIDKASREARVKAIIDIVGTNPYTQEPIENETDVLIYEEMKAYEKNGGDPVADQAKIIKGIYNKDRSKREQEEKEAQAKLDADQKAKSEIEEFTKAYPSVDLNKLLKDENFADYADGKYGKRTLVQLYEGFNKLHKAPEVKQDVSLEAQKVANEKASTGSLKGEPNNPKGYITLEQFKNMSREERVKRYEEISKSMANWK